jgi:membrane associated rhomboid family serine protease
MPPARVRRPAWLRTAGTGVQLAIAIVACSLLATLSLAAEFLPLFPASVLRGAIWQLLTYQFVADSPLGVLFDALIVWQIGTALEASWGRRRMLGLALGIPAIAGAITVVLARLLIPGIQLLGFFGATVMASTIWVGYGLAHGRSQINFWGIPISGNLFAGIGALFVVLNAAFSSWLRVLPDALAIALTLGYLRLGSPRTWLLRFQSWRFRRQLKARSTHLKLIVKDRNTRDDSDRYLH